MKLSPESAKKISGYVGFATRAGKITIGVDNILACRKRMLILADITLKENSRKKLDAYAEDNGVKILTVENMSEIFPREGVKAIGIREKNLADAIQKQFNK